MIQLKEMNDIEFKEYVVLSFESYIEEIVSSSEKTLEEAKKHVGSPPDTRTDDDLWHIVKLDDMDIGYTWVKILEDKSAFVYDFFIEEDFRSKGIGKVVLSCIQSILRSKDIEKLGLCVFEVNTIARKLYKSMGFEEIDFNHETKQFTLRMSLS